MVYCACPIHCFCLRADQCVPLALYPTDRPITYLYNTFHYYERKLREQPSLKRKLVQTVLGSQKDNRPQGWCLSEMYLNSRREGSWTPDDSYYCKLMARLVDNILAARSGILWKEIVFPFTGVKMPLAKLIN